jgi:hypothetical protein
VDRPSSIFRPKAADEKLLFTLKLTQAMASTKAEYFMDEIIDWKRNIAFYTDEIYGLTSRLGAVIQRNSIPNIAERVEKHQHELDVVSEKFDRLRSQFRRQAAMLKSDSHLIDDSQMKEEILRLQQDIRQKQQATEEKFIHTKNECQEFLASIQKK